MKVHAIRTGSVCIKTAQIEGRGHGTLDILVDRNWSDWLPTFAWAIEHDEGVILVDTGQASHLLGGYGRSLHPFFRWEVRFQIEPEEEIGPQLRSLGIGSRDVKRVVMTHLHMDHDAGLAYFPNSEILVEPGELQQASGFAGKLRGYLPQYWPKGFNPTQLVLDGGPLGPFGRSKRLTRAGDVIAIATPGHTPNHISVLVENSDATIFLAGDTSYNEGLMLAGKVDGVGSNTEVSAATLATIKRFAAAQPTIYLPTHDPESAARLASRRLAPGRLVSASA